MYMKSLLKILLLDCAEYEFEVKFFGPSRKELGKVSRIRLLSLADVPGTVITFLIQLKIHFFGTSSKNVGKVFRIHILSLADVQDILNNCLRC